MKRLLPLCIFMMALTASSAYSASRFGELVEQYEIPHLGPDSYVVKNISFSVGHVKVVMSSGTATPVMAGKEICGIYFNGEGSFQYQSADPIESSIVSFNVRKESHLKSDGSAKQITLSGNMRDLLLLTGGVPLPELTEKSGPAQTSPFTQHLDFFRNAQVVPAAHLLLQQRLSFPASKVAIAEIRGGGDDLIYTFDGAEAKSESLLSLSHPDSEDSTIKSRLYPAILSDQPVDRDRKTTPKPPFLLTAIDYTLSADGDNAKLKITETISRQSEQQELLRFNMNQSRFVRVGSPLRSYHVTSITDEKGRSLPFHHLLGDLIVGVEGVSGESFKLTFSIEGDFLVRPNNDNAWQLGVTSWFPQPELNGQFYTVHSVIKVRKPFIAIAPGKTVSREVEGDFNVVENIIDRPVQFAVVHAGKYEFSEETRGDLTIRVASYAGKNERAMKQLTNLAFSIIEYYQYFLGPFPFSEFNIIQVNTFGYGQAPPATMFITNEALDSMIGEVNRFFSQGINERFAHEIAHQYWGHVVKMPSEEEQWLTESFAEYSAALALKKYKGNGIYDRLVAGWKQRAKESTALAPIPLANRIGGDEMNASQARFGLLYAKGPYLLYTIHKQVGDDQFLTFLKSYQKSFRWKFGSTNDVAGLLQFITKKDFTPFIDQYFWGTAMP